MSGLELACKAGMEPGQEGKQELPADVVALPVDDAQPGLPWDVECRPTATQQCNTHHASSRSSACLHDALPAAHLVVCVFMCAGWLPAGGHRAEDCGGGVSRHGLPAQAKDCAQGSQGGGPPPLLLLPLPLPVVVLLLVGLLVWLWWRLVATGMAERRLDGAYSSCCRQQHAMMTACMAGKAADMGCCVRSLQPLA